MRSLFVLILETKFKFNRIFLNGIWISRRVARIPVSGEISEIPGEKKILGVDADMRIFYVDIQIIW
jgi:hypothetical protein